ncbi:guanylate kinase [Desulfovibrio litoralis]|uniref:Guanylate kinase n=1 Tax=Desulfovibrio litoralis DSM 11393 TaxID=1121455 RepID=A0A1M7SGB8_9BACT|nr:guanylate kinase [Desulfovibrio litoralis]SHN57382.1 guanylate kinase [Desulfovibrio litoralis DSM 11393]
MNTVDRKGIALIICAPSGAGKTTLTKRLLSEFPRFVFSVSYTTRPPRPHEVHGKDYYFVTKEEFSNLINENYFAEWATVHGNYYGTPLQNTINTLADGNDILFDVDVQGARQIKASLKNLGRYVFVLPPSRRVLEQRLRSRGTDSDEVIARRLSVVTKEIADAPLFDCVIINDDIKTAYDELRSAYIAATLAPVCRSHFLNDLLKQWS